MTPSWIMSRDENIQPPQPDSDGAGGGAGTAVRTRPAPPRVDRLPPWRVLLHNDDVNDMDFVVRTIRKLTALTNLEAVQRMLEAHHKGLALLITTHREHAELLTEQFASRGVTTTIEPDR